MLKFESNIKHITSSQEKVFNKLSDLSNLASMQAMLADKVDDLTFDKDSVSFNVKGIHVTMHVVEREPHKYIKYATDQAPVPLYLWVQILPEQEEGSKIKVTMGAEVNMFMKPMLSKPLKEGVEKIADVLTMIPY